MSVKIEDVSQDELQNAQRMLDRAKIAILTRSVFLATISFELRHFFATSIDGTPIPTAGTDGLSVAYNPKFVNDLTDEELIGLVAHEIWHVAFDHMGRAMDRDHMTWNKAGDYVINAMLLKAGYQLPQGGLYNAKWANLSSEEVYEILYKEDPPKPGGQGTPPPGTGSDIFKPGSFTAGTEKGTAADVANAKQKIAGILSKAKTAAEMAGQAAGNIPGEIAIHIDKLLNPVIPWNQYLQRFMSDFTKQDYSRKRPNKRFWPDYFLPTQHSPTIGHIAVAIDTSCSMTDRQLQEVYTELDNIRATFMPELMTVLGCDTKIRKVYVLNQFDDTSMLKFKGRGGTKFGPVMEWGKKEKPEVLLYFTDLEAEHYTKEDEPGFATLWVCFSKHRPQGIGETIYYDQSHRPKTK